MGEEELKVLYAKRGSLKGTVTRFSRFLDQVNDQLMNQLQIRLDKLDKILDEFDEVQLRIELLKPTELELTVREDFETCLFESMSLAKEKLSVFYAKETKVNQLNNSSISGMANSLSTGIQIQGSDLELRKFSLPTFNGDYDKWFKFKNTFVSLVDKNLKFDNVQKFYRLLECLKGDAEKVLSELEVSDDNYDVAWNILVERFEDKPGIIQKHLKALVDIDTIQRDSVYDIRKFVDEINGHWRALKSLGEPIEKWDRMLILILSRKLPMRTKMCWEEARIGKFKGEPSIDDFKAYLVEKCKSLEANIDKEKQLKTNHQNYLKKDIRPGAYVAMNYEVKCKFCKAQHQIYYCEKLKELPIEKRWVEIKNLRLCTNCLRSNHYVKECKSDGCRKCGIKHNTILHNEVAKNIKINNEIASVITSGQEQSTSAQSGIDTQEILSAHCNSLNKSQMLLSTTIVYIRDTCGNYVKARCLLDTGSQSCFMTTKLLKILGLPVSSINLPVVGVNKNRSIIKMKTHTRIKSVYSSYMTDESFFILEQITSVIPNMSFDRSKLNIPNNINLADDTFNVAAEVDLLLNARIFFEILCEGQIRLGAGLPILQETLFGWIVAGPLTMKQKCTYNESVCNLSIFNELNDIEKFWCIEEIESNQNEVKFSREEIECEQHFSETINRNDNGKFIVTLPTRTNVNELGYSLNMAEKRLFAMERKFNNNFEFKRLCWISFIF